MTLRFRLRFPSGFAQRTFCWALPAGIDYRRGPPVIWRIFFGLQGLVLAHELGHFLVARLVRVRVEVVSLGMGPRLFGFRTRDTDYRISLLPFGGYVRVLETKRDDEGLGVGAWWQELAVLLAGPAASLALPFFLYTATHARATDTPAPEIGDIEPGYPAEGVLAPGDIVRQVEKEPIETYWDLERAFSASHQTPRTIELTRDGHELTVRLPAAPRAERAGVFPYAARAVIGVADPESPAYRAGLRSMDEVVAVGGHRVTRWSELVTLLVKNRGDAVQIAYLRPVSGGAWDGVGTYEPHVAVLTGKRSSAAGNRDNAYLPRELEQRTGIVRGDLVVCRVGEGGVSWAAGLRAGDIVTAVDGELVGTAWGVRSRLRKGPSHLLSVRRNGVDMTMKLEGDAHRWFDSFDFDTAETRVRGARFRRVPGTSYVLSRASRDARDTIWAAWRSVWVMTVGASVPEGGWLGRIGSSLRDLSGAGDPGGDLVLYANLSAQLGLVNLLPLPMLDGGNVVWSLYARIFRGKWYAGRRAKRIWDRTGWVLLSVLGLWVVIREFGASM